MAKIANNESKYRDILQILWLVLFKGIKVLEIQGKTKETITDQTKTHDD